MHEGFKMVSILMRTALPQSETMSKIIAGNMAGMSISLSAVLQWTNDEELRLRVADEVLSGRKKICLGVTEAFAGSDVGKY